MSKTESEALKGLKRKAHENNLSIVAEPFNFIVWEDEAMSPLAQVHSISELAVWFDGFEAGKKRRPRYPGE